MRDERRRIQLNLILDISRFLLFTSFGTRNSGMTGAKRVLALPDWRA
jgi:hypothetical protein